MVGNTVAIFALLLIKIHLEQSVTVKSLQWTVGLAKLFFIEA
jgi:hypothetical protein